jgi:hypothetical protein
MGWRAKKRLNISAVDIGWRKWRTRAVPRNGSKNHATPGGMLSASESLASCFLRPPIRAWATISLNVSQPASSYEENGGDVQACIERERTVRG